jgi:hypothetical protein
VAGIGPLISAQKREVLDGGLGGDAVADQSSGVASVVVAGLSDVDMKALSREPVRSSILTALDGALLGRLL